MKLTKKIKTGALLSLLLASSTYASSGNGTIGGGQGVYENGKLQLRDLVDPSTCSWISGESILATNVELQDYLKKIKSIHWFFELALKKEISSLDFCWTKNEINQAYTGSSRAGMVQNNGIMIYETVSAVPVALRVRTAREVYVQDARYLELGPQSRALLIIHEALHSFMPVSSSVETYYTHLFSMVKTISEITGNSASERSSFELAIRKNNLMMIDSAQSLSDQNFLTYLFANYSERRSKILSNEITVKELIRQRPFNFEALPAANQSRIEFAKTHLFDELFQEFCRNQDEAVLSVLRQQTNSQFNIDLYCLTLPGILDQIIDHPERFDDGAVKQFMTQFYSDLSQATPLIKNGRVMVTKQINQISGNPALKPKYRYALEVRSPILASGRESAEIHLQQYARILVAGAMVKSVDSWLNLVKQDSAFLNAFDFKRVETTFGKLNSPIADELPAAVKNVKAVYTATLEAITDALREHDLDDHADALIQYINQSNLGVQVREE